MTTSTTVPVTVRPEAAARIAQLGFQAEVDRMIDHARRELPAVVRIEVGLNERYDTGDESGVTIAVSSERPVDPADRTFWDLAGWMVTTFPPDVLEHVHVSYRPGAGHAG